jgi:hypothetical protein
MKFNSFTASNLSAAISYVSNSLSIVEHLGVNRSYRQLAAKQAKQRHLAFRNKSGVKLFPLGLTPTHRDIFSF